METPEIVGIVFFVAMVGFIAYRIISKNKPKGDGKFGSGGGTIKRK